MTACLYYSCLSLKPEMHLSGFQKEKKNLQKPTTKKIWHLDIKVYWFFSVRASLSGGTTRSGSKERWGSAGEDLDFSWGMGCDGGLFSENSCCWMETAQYSCSWWKGTWRNDTTSCFVFLQDNFFCGVVLYILTGRQSPLTLWKPWGFRSWQSANLKTLIKAFSCFTVLRSWT